VAAAVDRPFADATANVLGSLRVLEGARACGARKVVYAASGGTLYGDVEGGALPVNEQHPHEPRSPYGVAKKVVVDYLRVYRELYGLEFTALALSNVYGPRQDPNGEAGVVAVFASNVLLDKGCTINGDGAQTRDYLFVDDAVDAFARAAERGSGLVLNIGTGVETSVNDLYATIATIAGSSARPRHGPAREGEVRRSALDSSRAELHLGWRAWTSLGEGVAAVLEALAARPASRRAPR
jgi:UDP-glucose 4-epimerase